MSPRNHILVVFALAAAACGVPATTAQQGALIQEAKDTAEARKTTTTTTSIETKKAEDSKVESSKVEKKEAFECPVTIPPETGFVATEPEIVTYSKHFPAPDPWPAEYPHEDMVWYGSGELWTALDVDGDHSGRKSVWWSVNFPGGAVEERPEVWVTWTRLDTNKPVVIDNDGIATNAHTSREGWFMIAGIDPPQQGCWEVEATYKGATLSYVYEKTG